MENVLAMYNEDDSRLAQFVKESCEALDANSTIESGELRDLMTQSIASM